LLRLYASTSKCKHGFAIEFPAQRHSFGLIHG
jgi:hypothetical protein